MKLPPKVRRAIYDLAGLKQDATEVFIDLNCWNNRQPAVTFQDAYSENILESEDSDKLSHKSSLIDEARERVRLCVNWKSRIPINLLHLSHAIHDEVEEALYNSHIWGVSASGPGGLDVLEGLSPSAVKAMRCLVISLTPCICTGCLLTGVCTYPIPIDLRLELVVNQVRRAHGFGSYCGDWSREEEDTYRSEGSLDIRSRHARRTLAQWERICEKLAHHAELGRLSLYVHCAVKDVKTAERITDPLRRLNKSLNDLGISFGPRNGKKKSSASHGELEQQLSLLAKATVEAAKHQPSFPFFNLPTELQLHVLSFTHLVNDPGFELKFIAGRPVLSHHDSHGSEEEIIDFSRVDGHYAWLLGEAFCAEGNTAFYGRCRCIQVPASYFLVSRKFYELAMELFYGRNRIVAAYNDFRWCVAAKAVDTTIIPN